MIDWKEYRLGDIADVQTGPFGSQLHQSDYKITGTPIITVEHLGDNKIIHENLPLVSDEDKERLKKYILKVGDIVFSRVGSVDRRAYVSQKEDNWMFSGRCLRVRTKNNVNSLFLSYFFGNENFKEHIRQVAVGATMPSINTQILSEIMVLAPPLPEQSAIAETLSSLDNKIDLLHRQNKTLEELAETLFTNLLSNHLKDSKTGKLSDEFVFTMGQSPPGESYNESGNGTIFFQGRTDFGFRFPMPRLYTTDPKRHAKKHETLISLRAPVGDMNIAFEDCCIGRGLSSFRYKKIPKLFSYTYYKLKTLKDEISQFEDNGTVFGSISKDDFSRIELSIPTTEIAEQLDIIISPIDKKIFANHIQIQTLQKLRDTLLPKLMSGEVRVKTNSN